MSRRRREIYVRELVLHGPTDTSMERYMRAAIEVWSNRPVEELGGRAPWEVGLTETGRREIEAGLRDGTLLPIDRALVARYLAVLGPPSAPGARLIEAWDCAGGLLNVFNPRADEADDERWPALLAGLPEGSGREAALARARLRWNDTPNELFAELTPAQVWAGTGPAEYDLMQEFSAEYGDYEDPDGYESSGALLQAALLFLRAWQCQPRASIGGRRPEEVVREERAETLRRKREILRAR